MDADFEIVESTRGRCVPGTSPGKVSAPVKARIVEAATDPRNFSQILSIAADIVDIARLQAMTDAQVSIMKERRKELEAATRDYVQRINAETNRTVSNMEAIRLMMNDYYMSGSTALSSEQFANLIREVIEHMDWGCAERAQ